MKRVVTGEKASKKTGKVMRPEPTLTQSLGDKLREVKIEKPPMQQAVEALRGTLDSWKRKIREANANAHAVALMDAAAMEQELEASGLDGRLRDEAEGRLHVKQAIAEELTQRVGWAWRDEVESLLSDAERAFIGMSRRDDGTWEGGFWRNDWEVRGSARAATPGFGRMVPGSARLGGEAKGKVVGGMRFQYEVRPTRKEPVRPLKPGDRVPAHNAPSGRQYVEGELLDAIAARRMYQLERAVDGADAARAREVVLAFVAHWRDGVVLDPSLTGEDE